MSNSMNRLEDSLYFGSYTQVAYPVGAKDDSYYIRSSLHLDSFSNEVKLNKFEVIKNPYSDGRKEKLGEFLTYHNAYIFIRDIVDSYSEEAGMTITK